MKRSKPDTVKDIYELHIPQKVWRFVDRNSLDDFSQYCYQLLLEIPDDQFNKLVEEGQIANYFYVICRRQAQPGSTFWRECGGRIDTVSLDEYEQKTNFDDQNSF